VYSDHKNLLTFTTTKILNRRQVRWAEELASYKFKIYYRKGSKNGKTDALNRRSDYLVKKRKEPAVILKIDNQKIISYNINFIAEVTNYAVESVTKIIRDFYNDTTAGHKEITQTLNKIRRTNIQLPKILEKIREYIAACDIYSRTKHKRYKPYRLIKSPDIPDGP
jgi:predicted ATPase